ncbi:MAG TPA: hypothetical protein VG328_04315 [Stellaceae bacterium]|nr:hypothetical protein [Stellaceae bacterium]
MRDLLDGAYQRAAGILDVLDGLRDPGRDVLVELRRTSNDRVDALVDGVLDVADNALDFGADLTDIDAQYAEPRIFRVSRHEPSPAKRHRPLTETMHLPSEPDHASSALLRPFGVLAARKFITRRFF